MKSCVSGQKPERAVRADRSACCRINWAVFMCWLCTSIPAHSEVDGLLLCKVPKCSRGNPKVTCCAAVQDHGQA